MFADFEEFKFYPAQEDISKWVESIWYMAKTTNYEVEPLRQDGFSHSLGVRHVKGYHYVKFNPDGMAAFYGYWQPAISTPAPLLVHVPGYGAAISIHPELVSAGYNVICISPMGYVTPSGPDGSKRREGAWPVLPDTIISGAEKGYRVWLANCIMAIKWAMKRPEVIENRVSFFGTSQGGGGALLLGSVYKDKGVRCVAADLPFLTNFPMARGRGAYLLAEKALQQLGDRNRGWRALGFVDTLSHASRLTIPVILTAGGKDAACPPETVGSLFPILPETRAFVYLNESGHRYTTEFIQMALSWFRLYA